jgi:hypothetical protein
MLTYPICTSMAPLAKDSLSSSVARRWLDQNPKETKETNGDFLDFVV